jgi:hypothetical protein
MIQNPFCPTPLAPKEMLQGGFGNFYFCKKLRRMALGFNDEDAAEMTKRILFQSNPNDSFSSSTAPTPR